MNVSELMTLNVQACSIHDNLQRAAQVMWETDCGSVPIVDDELRVVGMLTDRDICMAGFTQGKVYADIPVTSAMSKQVFGVGRNDLIETAEALMRSKRIHRLPVLDGGGRLRGILSLNDIARHTQRTHRQRNGLSGDTIAQTLAAICEPHAQKSMGGPS